MFAKYVEQMHNSCELLNKNHESGTQIGRLVCKGLEQVAHQSTRYDALVASTFPFKQHFFDLLTSLRTVEDGTFFALFEDLALFVRIRMLKEGMDALSQAEKDILNYFETCGEWQQDDRSLVAESYWYKLPEQIRSA